MLLIYDLFSSLRIILDYVKREIYWFLFYVCHTGISGVNRLFDSKLVIIGILDFSNNFLKSKRIYTIHNGIFDLNENTNNVYCYSYRFCKKKKNKKKMYYYSKNSFSNALLNLYIQI